MYINILLYFCIQQLKKYENTNDFNPAVWDINNSNPCVRWRDNMSAIISCININLIYH